MAYDPDLDLAPAKVDPLTTAFRQKDAAPLYAGSLSDGRGTYTPEQLTRLSPMADPVSASSSGYDPDEDLGLKEAPGKLESLGRGALQGVSFGFSDEITGLVESAFGDKSYSQARDEARKANKAAKEANPWSYGIGEVGAGIAGAALTGGAGLAARAGLTGVRAAAALGAVEGAVSGIGTAEGGVEDSIKSALVGGVTGGALAGAAGKIFGKYAANAERNAARNVTKELTEGAIPTQSRRFADMKELAFDVLEPDKAFMKAAKAKPERAQEIARDRLGDLGPKTHPIYARLDNEVGKVPLADWESHFNKRIDEIRADFKGDNAVADALEEARDGFVAKAIANSRRTNKGVTTDVSHKDIRDYVTALYKHKFRKLGSISETENFHLAAEAFSEADSFLKGRLNSYRTGNATSGAAPRGVSEETMIRVRSHRAGAEDLRRQSNEVLRQADEVAKDPSLAVEFLGVRVPNPQKMLRDRAAELAKAADASEARAVALLPKSPPAKAGRSIDEDLDELTNLNRQIKAWAGAESLMGHKTGREFWKRGGLEALASGKMGQLSAMAGVGGALATGSPFGAAIGLVPKGVQGIAAGTQALNRKATSALARLSKAARAGDVTKAMYLESIKDGVAASTAIGVLNTMKNRPAWADEVDDGDDDTADE